MKSLVALTISSLAGLLLPNISVADDTGLASNQGEFRFARLAYSTDERYRSMRYGGREYWQMDWPEAEFHLIKGIQRLTRVDTADLGHTLRLTDPELFDFPWLYAVEVGHWVLDETEAALLRAYLLRGGFLMVDDFHGTREWTQFMVSMQKVFPNRAVRDIPPDDESLHVLYDLDQRIQIPSIQILRSGRTYEQDGYTPRWRGIYDDHGRLMVAINFNMDIGDAWEHADTPQYPENMTALGYRFGVSYILYAMTH